MRAGEAGRRLPRDGAIKQTTFNQQVTMKRLFTLAATLLLAGVVYAGEVQDITIPDLKAAIDAKKVTLLDANGTKSWKEGHIPARSISRRARTNWRACCRRTSRRWWWRIAADRSAWRTRLPSKPPRNLAIPTSNIFPRASLAGRKPASRRTREVRTYAFCGYRAPRALGTGRRVFWSWLTLAAAFRLSRRSSRSRRDRADRTTRECLPAPC